MQRLKNYAIWSLTIAVLVYPSTTSSQIPERSQQPQGPSTPATKFVKAKKPIPNRYIVVLNDDVVSDNAPLEVRRARITDIANRHAQTYGGKADYIYETALKGYAIELPNEAAAIAISKLDEVRWVEEDQALVPGNYPTKQEAVCRGKSAPVSLLERPFGLKVYGRRLSFLPGGISQRTRLVIRSRDEFNELWKGVFRSGSDKPPLPEVDFSREMIVVAAMGQQPSSGFEILIDGGCEVGDRLEVFVRSTSFFKCGLQLGIVTEPVDMVRLPKTDLPVVFRETEVTSDCKELLRP